MRQPLLHWVLESLSRVRLSYAMLDMERNNIKTERTVCVWQTQYASSIARQLRWHKHSALLGQELAGLLLPPYSSSTVGLV